MKRSKKIAIGAAAASLVLSAATTVGCSFDPADNENVDVYGPPPEDAQPIDENDGFDPDDNYAPAVYGPPEEFLVEENQTLLVYGPPPDAESAPVDEQ